MALIEVNDPITILQFVGIIMGQYGLTEDDFPSNILEIMKAQEVKLKS